MDARLRFLKLSWENAVFGGIIARRMKLHLVVAGLLISLAAPIQVFSAPRILFTDILAGPSTGGENGNGCYLSIFGRGFGSSRGTSKVLINGVEVAVYKYWGPAQYANGAGESTPGQLGIEQISVQPGAAVQSGVITVEVNGETSNRDHSFTVRPGKIFFVVPGDGIVGVPGDINKPFADLEDTFNRADFEAGDFIVLRGGVYTGTGANGRWLNVKRGGTRSLPVTVYGYPGELVLFEGYPGGKRGIAYSTDGNTEGFVFANIKFHSNADSMINVGGRNGDFNLAVQKYVRLVNIDLHAGQDGRAGTLAIRRCDHLKILGVYIHDNFVAGPGLGSKYTHQMYFSDGSDDVEVGWVELARFDGGVTIAIRKSLDTEPLIVHTNFDMHEMIIHDQTTGPINFGRSVGTGIKFYNNLMYRVGQHHGLSDGAVNLNAGIYIDQDNGKFMEVEFHHNIIYDAGNINKPNGCFSFYSPGKMLVMRNNIFVVLTPDPYSRMYQERGSTPGAFDQTTVDSAYNIWWHPGGVTRWEAGPGDSPESKPPAWIFGNTDLIGDPLFVRPSTGPVVSPSETKLTNLVIPDFSLQAGSPAIGSGTRVPVIDYGTATGAPNRGVIEFGISASQTNELTPGAPKNLRVR